MHTIIFKKTIKKFCFFFLSFLAASFLILNHCGVFGSQKRNECLVKNFSCDSRQKIFHSCKKKLSRWALQPKKNFPHINVNHIDACNTLVILKTNKHTNRKWTYSFNFITCFTLFCFGSVLFSKIDSFGLGLSFDFFVFWLIVVKFESGVQKKNLSSCNLVLIWFGYRGVFNFGYAISLRFCDVSKLRWLIDFTI